MFDTEPLVRSLLQSGVECMLKSTAWVVDYLQWLARMWPLLSECLRGGEVLYDLSLSG